MNKIEKLEKINFFAKLIFSKFSIIFPILMLFIFAQSVSAASIPKINSYVTDNAGILSPNSKAQLENELGNLEKSTNGVQFSVYIEKEYPKEFSLEDYTLKIAEYNRIGKKGNDNGILLYVAVNDKKYRWETGYGVEGTLNSPLLGRLSREYIVPNFKAGDYENGILQSVDAVKRLLLGSNDADIVALKSSANERFNNAGITPIIAFFVFFMIMTAFSIHSARNAIKSQKGGKHRDSIYHGAAWGLFAGGFGRGGFRGGSGGFGGFSGGGGGFGGGGSSGGW